MCCARVPHCIFRRLFSESYLPIAKCSNDDDDDECRFGYLFDNGHALYEWDVFRSTRHCRLSSISTLSQYYVSSRQCLVAGGILLRNHAIALLLDSMGLTHEIVIATQLQKLSLFRCPAKPFFVSNSFFISLSAMLTT